MIKFLRKLVLRKRLMKFREYKGWLYSRKYQINPISKSLEIMSMYMVYKYINNDCVYVVFTIFDYVTRKIVLECIYDKL